MNRLLGNVTVFAMFVVSAAAFAGAYFERGGAAIDGYDPVAYFKENKPVKGSSSFTATHGGSTFRFASAANRDAFVSDPQKYAPQYGGFCAYAVANGYKAKIEPDAFHRRGSALSQLRPEHPAALAPRHSRLHPQG